MKKVLLLALVLVLALAMVACGGTADDTTIPTDVTSGTDTPADPSAHTHSYVEAVTVEPTCTSLGKKVMKCACGEIEEGSEMPLPFAEHNANAATCTEDSVCATCGKLLVEKYGHLYVDSVVTAASCTIEGLAKSECHRCGDSTETRIAAGHDFDLENITVSKGTVGSKCKKCGETANFAEKSVLLKLDFDKGEAEFADYPAYKITKPEGMKFENSALQTNGALWFKYSGSIIPANAKLLVSFDLKLTANGLTHRGESIFSFVSRTASNYSWLLKYYEADGVLSTAGGSFNSSNSVPAKIGQWYNVTSIIDTATNKASVYVDGKYIGAVEIPNHTDAKYKDNFELRFFDVASNGVSMPYFDNFKFVVLQ